MKTKHKTILALAATVAVISTNADDRYWQTATDGDASVGENWTDGVAPTAG